jgi:diaminopimelate decarboxylase
MSFAYRNGILHCESVSLEEIAAQAGTPVFVYSAEAILERYRAYDQAFGPAQPHTVCYAVKANSNLAILKLLADAGAGFDIVSGGELYRVLKAGGDPAKVVFSGVGKSPEEIEYALSNGIYSFNSESEPELHWISAAAVKLGKQARVALRVNPDVNASTHEYISTGLKEHKFGIDISLAEEVYLRAAKLPGLVVDNVSCHIGSQILDPSSLVEAIDRVLALVGRLRKAGLGISHVDLGGGLGVAYKPEDEAPSIRDYVEKLSSKLEGWGLHATIEPGRSLVAESGALISRVLLNKQNGEKLFTIVDAAMNDLLRPSLYKAHHEIQPVRINSEAPKVTADIVGPVCESGDFLAKNREIQALERGDLIAVRNAGAYGFVMASNYNSRPRAAEVLVEGSEWRIVRKRETLENLILGEG